MKKNYAKEKIKNGEAVLGVISNTSDPMIAEFCGHGGLDYYMIDCEHGAINISQVQDIVRACECSGITPMARIRSTDPKLILQFMDAGIMGVMMPGVSEVSEIEQLVSAMKYPPVGNRGLGPVRAWNFGLGKMPQAEYVKFANEQTLVLPQIEDMKCVENLENLCKVPGLDGFIIGPRDLAMSMGFYDGPAHDEVKKVIDHIFEVVLSHGLIIGTTAATAEQAKALKAKGATIIMNYVGGMLGASIKSFIS
jgi:4-hydroxy-2-oxoheptanedioate aldolase